MQTEIKLYDSEEVAEIFQTHVNTIHMLRETGLIHPIKIGKKYLYLQDDLLSFINNGLGYDFTNREQAEQSIHLMNLKNNNNKKSVG